MLSTSSRGGRWLTNLFQSQIILFSKKYFTRLFTTEHKHSQWKTEPDSSPGLSNSTAASFHSCFLLEVELVSVNFPFSQYFTCYSRCSTEQWITAENNLMMWHIRRKNWHIVGAGYMAVSAFMVHARSLPLQVRGHKRQLLSHADPG